MPKTNSRPRLPGLLARIRRTNLVSEASSRLWPGYLALALAASVTVGGCSFNLDTLPGMASKKETVETSSPNLATLSEAIKANPNDPEAYYQRGLVYQAENQHEHAIADFSSAIGLSARQTGALAARAASYLDTGKTHEAAADLDEAVRLEPENAGIWTLRGQAYEKLDDTTKAAGSYQRAMALSPDDEAAAAGFKRIGGRAEQTYEPF